MFYIEKKLFLVPSCQGITATAICSLDSTQAEALNLRLHHNIPSVHKLQDYDEKGKNGFCHSKFCIMGNTFKVLIKTTTKNQQTC